MPNRLRRDPAFRNLESLGVHLPEAVGFINDNVIRDNALAMDAQPQLVTASNAGIPAFLATFIDPDIIKVLFSPVKAAEIMGEVKKGDWVTDTAVFPISEETGTTTAYGDYNETGASGLNVAFPQRQSFHYQIMTQWGEREMERAGLAKINWATGISLAAINVLNRTQNNTYFFGVAGLQNYGLLNDPTLSAPIAPGPKAFGSKASGPWITSGAVTATANEIFADIQSMFLELIAQSGGTITQEDEIVLAMSPTSAVALTATNSFNVNVSDLLKKNFPKLRVETAVQYATASGSLVQMIAKNVEGQETGYCAFTEKLRAHRVVPGTSSFKQKRTQGTWGTVIRQPFAIASMLGV